MDYLATIWKHLTAIRITTMDVVDILLISLVVYRVLVEIRGTRAAKMAVGIGFLVAGYYLADVLHLPVTRWALTNLAPYMAFVIIIVYQDEIRKILSNIGSSRFFLFFASKEKVPDYEEIVLASVTLSSKRIGALVLIERFVGLRNYMENGIVLNSNLSYDLLVTVFHPETPLHDGAVIVQRDKIAAASCFLPLTLDPHLSKEYGTRHRAAIGITEETDAVAVVVSEETGRISVAVDGKLKRINNSDELSDFLRLMTSRTARRFQWFGAFRKDKARAS